MSHMFYSAQNYPEPNTHEHWWQTSRAGRATAFEMNSSDNKRHSSGIIDLLAILPQMIGQCYSLPHFNWIQMNILTAIQQLFHLSNYW